MSDLHPANRLEWLVLAERDQAVCFHCGEPTPCVEAVLRHQHTEEHHWLCVPTGNCYYDRRGVFQ